MIKKICSLLLLLLLCTKGEGAEKLSVFVSILPQKYFAEQIGGDRVTVSVLVEKGRDPHTFEPLPGQMAGLARAQGYFSIGLPFEKSLLPRISKLNPSMKIFAVDESVDKIFPSSDHEEENHSEKEHHHDSGADPHVWNSPAEAEVIARNMRDALIELDPSGKDEYLQAFEALSFRLKSLDEELKALFSDRKGASFLVFHPGWAYLARTYGLRGVAIEVDGKEPKASDIAKIIEEARENNVKVIFISPQFSKKSASVIAEAVGAAVKEANPLAEEWEKNLRAVASAIAESAK
ncbi:MAG: zinc ABC transporter solute-binding protein [Synergistaceae bacterium]|nr:zinc ABC transporter solute-binding protein [Synergistaceae bacterium]